MATGGMLLAALGRAMPGGAAVPIVRCRLDGRKGTPASLRYIPLVEFELWRHFMQTRHRRRVLSEGVTIWVPEQGLLWEAGFSPEDLEPVLRLHLEIPGPYGVTIPVDRYLPAETYPRAREALLGHFAARGLRRAPTATPGYVIPVQERKSDKTVA
jgi:hypothetical protein